MSSHWLHRHSTFINCYPKSIKWVIQSNLFVMGLCNWISSECLRVMEAQYIPLRTPLNPPTLQIYFLTGNIYLWSTELQQTNSKNFNWLGCRGFVYWKMCTNCVCNNTASRKKCISLASIPKVEKNSLKYVGVKSPDCNTELDSTCNLILCWGLHLN